MCREILSPIHEDLAVSSGLDASDVWRCAGHGLYVQLPRTLSSTGGEHASKAICSSTRPPKWILWKPAESITDLITLLVMTRSKVTWIVRKIQIISLIRADTTYSRPTSWKFLNEGELLRRRINNVATCFTSYLSTNQRFLRPVIPCAYAEALCQRLVVSLPISSSRTQIYPESTIASQIVQNSKHEYVITFNKHNHTQRCKSNQLQQI